MKRSIIPLSIALLTLLAPATATAGGPVQIDPALMQPPLNQSFAPWTCLRQGSGITCVGHRTIVRDGEENGLVCDGRPVYTDEIDERTQRRYGDANGLALRTVQNVDIRGIMGFNPDLSGITVRGAGHFQETFEYLVPGDITTRTDRYTGLDGYVVAPGLGRILLDVGVKTFDFDGNLLFNHGYQEVLWYGDAAFEQICDALIYLGA